MKRQPNRYVGLPASRRTISLILAMVLGGIQQTGFGGQLQFVPIVNGLPVATAGLSRPIVNDSGDVAYILGHDTLSAHTSALWQYHSGVTTELLKTGDIVDGITVAYIRDYLAFNEYGWPAVDFLIHRL